MENGQDAVAKVEPENKIDKFVDDMMAHAQELLVILRDQGMANDIKDRVTCLKYLEEVTKTYFVLKKATTHDPAAAGATVRKYASAFAKNATGVGAGGKRTRSRTATIPDTIDFDSDSDTAA